MSTAAFLLAYAGFASLCLAMDRHHAQVWGRDAPAATRHVLQVLGSLLLALAAWPCVQVWGATVGLVVWLGCLSVAALLWVGLLAYAPRWATAVAALGALGGLFLLLGF